MPTNPTAWSQAPRVSHAIKATPGAMGPARRRSAWTRGSLLVALALALSSCTGTIGSPTADDSPPPGHDDLPPPLPSGLQLAPRGMTRMSALEYDRALEILLGDDSRPGRTILPEDPRTPFDNDYEHQEASQALIEGEELLAQEAAARLLADPERRDALVGCTPTGPSDAECMRSFVSTFARRAFRRDSTADDVAYFVDGSGDWPGAMAHAALFDDFYDGVSSVVQIVLQDPEFLYRIEIGTPHEEAENVFRLNDYEIATRLSFFLWGAIPDDELLDAAQAGELQDPVVRMEQAERLMQNERARERFAFFHAMWLGYEKLLPGSELGSAMRQETRALTDRVLFTDNGPWQDLFRSESTYVNALLAENYGMPAPSGDGAWMNYDSRQRRGLFSHGSFLSIGLKGNDTSPVMRGIAIQRNAFCQIILPAPPGVDTDGGPVSEAVCKPERYAAHAEGGCASCHNRIDGVGFGLEAFDAQGAFREFEQDDPATEADESMCAIDGEGYLAGVGAFSGPAELAELGLESGLLRSCFVNHVHRLVTGRGDVRPVDQAVIEELDARLPTNDFTLTDLVQAVVANETFTLRREDI